jgi:hypothetical protein
MEQPPVIKKKSPLKYIIIGYILGVAEIVYGFILYNQFTKLEQHIGYTFRVKWLIKYSYKHFGKGLTCGLFIGTGVIIIAGITVWLINSRKKAKENI